MYYHSFCFDKTFNKYKKKKLRDRMVVGFATIYDVGYAIGTYL
jgi:hypothetical protein